MNIEYRMSKEGILSIFKRISCKVNKEWLRREGAKPMILKED